MKKIKILYIVPSLRLCNGIASYAMNYFRNIDNNNIQIDFIIGANEKSEYFDEIEKKGSKIYYIPKIEGIMNFFNVIKMIKNFFRDNKYDIIHCHVLNMGAFYLHYAKKYKVPIRILHSHATKYADSSLNNFRNMFLAKIAVKNANTYYACSNLAGKFLFRNQQFEIINNAINIENFKYNIEKRKQIRKEEKINDNEILIGNIGRFVPQKNLFFLIDIFKQLTKKSNKYKMILIGTGPQEKKLLEKIKENGLTDKVIIKKNITNVNEYMQAMDVFVLPSLYEGLPVVGIEAQASDLTCLLANTISQEAKITANVKFLPITDEKFWIEEINKLEKRNRKDVSEIILKSGYDIKTESKKLIDKYQELCKK